MLFKKEHIPMVLQHRKTQTRRIHKREWQIGKIYPFSDKLFGKPQGYVLITRKWKEPLGDISTEDVHKEGYNSLEEYKKAWERIFKMPWNPDLIVKAYEFTLNTKTPEKEVRKTNEK
jgi:hypothetical protein